MRSEQNIVCEFHISVVVETHISHTDPAIDGANGQPVGVRFQGDVHDRTFKVALAIGDFLVLHKFLVLDDSDLRVGAPNREVGHREIHDHRDVLKLDR